MSVAQCKAARRRIRCRYKKPHLRTVGESIMQERMQANREFDAKKRKKK